MSLLDDFKQQPGARTFYIGDLNRKATIKRPVVPTSARQTDPLEGITVTDEYLEVKGLLESGCQLVFVNGKAGTGKSTLIQYLRHSYKNNIVVVAPTGVAALNVQGVTLHSYFQLPPRIVYDSDIKRVKDRRLYTCLDLLIVDEISMVRADMIDAMDAFLRLNGRSRNLPFGGTQMLFVGDLFQLPPVVKKSEEKILDERGYSSPYFFSAKSLAKCQAGAIELTEIFRQRDPEFASMLNDIRVAENLKEVIPRINESCSSEADNSIITLTCTNAVADQINITEQLKLSSDPKTYHGQIIGKFVVEEERLPAPLNLELKVGAQVMFTKNDEMKRWVNGTLGKVVELLDNNIKVELISETQGIVVDVLPVEWESYKYEYDKVTDKIVPAVAGRYIQFPLMLAWAVTIHKSQGKTLEKVRVDFGNGAFASGQVYVALSRCRSLADIRLSRPIKISEVKCDPVILRFSQALNP
ncbi:MAG: DEAD/DEAH box helicase [Desulfuromonadaceae bacterium]|nr:DEAD/DEAH box helicase [Desulfuromonadaceae bacterium]MDD5104784.1 DEAD/DEAH box helicase [Desulfuromonadaceae bacterium]